MNDLRRAGRGEVSILAATLSQLSVMIEFSRPTPLREGGWHFRALPVDPAPATYFEALRVGSAIDQISVTSSAGRCATSPIRLIRVWRGAPASCRPSGQCSISVMEALGSSASVSQWASDGSP